MNRRYLLYLMLIPLAYVLYLMNKGYSTESPFFYGFAENKETEVSHYSDSYIEEILVSEGEAVLKGQPLMLISRRELPYKTSELEREQIASSALARMEQKALQTERSLLDQQRDTYLQELALQEQGIREVMRRRTSVVESLTTIDSASVAMTMTESAELAALQQKKEAYEDRYRIRYELLEQKIAKIAANHTFANERVTAETKRLGDDEQDLQILAPANGVIGNIPRKAGEYVTAYSTLLTYYEENPTMVKGYVHESHILEVNVGDSLYVASTLRSQGYAMGEVIGLGSRIIEIPERLRKIPTVKTYGREVLVRIPADNTLLQKEKVSINTDITTQTRQLRQTIESADKRVSKELSIKK